MRTPACANPRQMCRSRGCVDISVEGPLPSQCTSVAPARGCTKLSSLLRVRAGMYLSSRACHPYVRASDCSAGWRIRTDEGPAIAQIDR